LDGFINQRLHHFVHAFFVLLKELYEFLAEHVV
jgi:hypothetical protein